MNTKKMKCSLQTHNSQKVIKYCKECNICMCNECFFHHSKLFINHHLTDISGENGNIFIEFCKEENHSNKLEYFCKTHNQLCCLSCIGKDSNSENAKHKNCEFCKIEEIKEEKKSNLEKNLKLLEDLSNKIKEKKETKKLEDFYEKMEKLKEGLKSKVLQIITKIRNKLNEREDELISQIETTFSNLCPPEKAIKEYDNIPKKINDILEKRKEIDKKWNNSFSINSFIKDCINIENEFIKINEINDLINKYNINPEVQIYFYPEEKEIGKIFNDIKSFGKIYQQENERKNFFISESMKENKELEKKIKESENKIKKIENEYNNLKNEKEEIKKQLENEQNKNYNIRKEINNSKIYFTMRSHCALNKCLDMKSLDYGNSPHLWDYGHHNKNQIFELIKNNDGTYSIKSAFLDLYLGMDNDKIVFRKRNENSQSFYITHFEDGYYLFQDKYGGVIDLTDFKTNNGANIGRCPRRNNTSAQQWKLVIHL